MKLSTEQLLAAQDIIDGHNVFLSGNAGTGKSTVISHILSERRDLNFSVAATTGIAAINLRDQFAARFPEKSELKVSTIYSLAGIGMGPKPDELIKDCVERIKDLDIKKPVLRKLRNARRIIIDEISMLPGRVLETIDRLARWTHKSHMPFGGLQVVAVGDFLQLPPVNRTGSHDWAFLSQAWKELRFKPHVLQQVHRQNDPVFVDLLNAVRIGRINQEQERVLRSRVPSFPAKNTLRLFTHNVQVDKWNKMMLESIEEKESVHRLVSWGINEDAISELRKTVPVQDEIRLRKGARVMVLSNIRNQLREMILVNGSLATVIDPGRDGESVVILPDGWAHPFSLSRQNWHEDLDENCNKATINQIPLRLSWATTIHKSQGLSLDSALIDCRAAREPGQAYVALSRVKTLNGLWLKDMFSMLYTSAEAKKFMDNPF